MYNVYLLTDSAARRVTRRALGPAMLVACSALGACDGDSKSKPALSTGDTDAAAAGDSSQADGAAGATSETGTQTADADSDAGTDANSGTVTNGGTSDAKAVMSDDAGDGTTSGSGSPSGADGGCRDLCRDSAPACCSSELSCVERVPRCRIDILSGHLDTTYEYSDLEAKVGTWPGAVELSIPLDTVERASADPPPAARFELTLEAEASTALAALADMSSQPFRLSCDEQELFVGVVYMEEGAAAIRTPVLHVKQTQDGALVLRLGAWQGAWPLSGDGGTAELSERLDRAELRAQLCERGILDEIR